MDYYSMMTILGILFWVLAAIVCIGFLGWVYTQIIYMLLAKEDWKRDNQQYNSTSADDENNDVVVEEQESIDETEEI